MAHLELHLILFKSVEIQLQYSRKIILGILLLGVVSLGLNSDMLSAFGDGSTANHGDIGSTIESLEFSTDGVFDTNTLQITGDIFAVAYVDAGGEGQISTYTVDAAGVVSDTIIVGSNSPFNFATDDITDPQIFHITGTVYGIVYSDNGVVVVNTINISNTGTITNIVTSGAAARSDPLTK